MDDDGILDVLREIRDEAKETNHRLGSLEGRVDQTNQKLGSLEGRVDRTNQKLGSLEGRVDRTNQKLESLEGRVDQTNEKLESLDGRVDQTNQRLDSLGGRVEFLEKRVTKGFEAVSDQLERHVERVDTLTRQQTDSEVRLASEVLSLADVTREVRDLLSTKLDDHRMVLHHEERLKALEHRIGDRPTEP